MSTRNLCLDVCVCRGVFRHGISHGQEERVEGESAGEYERQLAHSRERECVT